MVVNDTNYTKRVPVQLGTLHIDAALSLVTGEEYGKLSCVGESIFSTTANIRINSSEGVLSLI